MKNIKLTWMLICIMTLGLGQVFAAWGGDYSKAVRPDTADGYFLIKNEDNLAWISDSFDGVASKIKVKLMTDLDMGGHSFIPLGAGKGDANAFGGIFDGNGYAIKNLFIHSDSLAVINNSYAQNIGFIGVLTGTLKNVSFDNVLIAASQDEGKIISGNASPISVGVAVGWMASGVVENVQTSGMITTSGKGQAVGGVVGYTEKYSNYSAPTINNCYSDVNIQTSGANVYVGGISGYTKSTVSISSVAFNGSIENSGTANAEGGIVGRIAGGTLTVNDCYYDSTAVSSGVAQGNASGSTSGTDNLNSEDVVCTLNGGTWDETTSTCSGETSDTWSVGQSDISINGSDGYTIAFSANGGSFASGAKTSKIVAKGATITASEIGVPTRSDYFFAGWSLSKDATEAGDLGTATAKDTIYAVWDAGYTVAFHSTPGVFSGNDSLKTIKVAKGGVVSVNGIEVPTTYTKNGVMYYFSGWTSAAAEESRLVEDVGVNDTLHLADIVLTNNVDLYAVWTKAETYSVTFNATLHGKTAVQFVKIVNEGEKASEPDTVITEAGYEVEKWCTDVDCNNEYGFIEKITQNITLYAGWKLIKYTIDYHLDDGVDNTGNPNDYTVKTDDIIFVDPTRTGYTFGGWYYDAAFVNKATQISTGTTGDITLYAKWTPITYTVKYLSGNTIPGVVSNDTKEYGVALTLKDSVSTFSHGGCTQKGWSLSDNGEVAYAFGGEYTGNADLTLYPHWECSTYNLTYETDGGNKGNNPDTYTGPAMLGLNNGSYSGFYFGGWYREISLKNQVSNVQNITTDLTLYAKWYNIVTYKPGSALSGSGAKDLSVNKNKDAHVTLKTSIDKYVRDGYKLVGWSTSDGGDVEYALGARYETNANITLYPCWAAYPVTVATYGAVTIQENQDGTTTAVIDGVYTGSDATAITSDVTVNSVVLNRSFNVNKISTLYVPFKIAAADVVGASVYKFKTVVKSDVDGRWKFKVAVTDSVRPNTPYVVLPSASTVSFNIADSVTLNTTTQGEATSNGHWDFIGTYAYISFVFDKDNPVYLFANQEKDGAKLGQFVSIATGAYTNPMRAYLVYHKADALAKSAGGNLGGNILLPDELDVEVENENGLVVETGVLNTVTGEVRMDHWFDMKGRRLNSKPSVKGIYYKNGKKIIIK